MRGPKMFLTVLTLLAVVVAPALAGAAPQARQGSTMSGVPSYRSIIDGRVTGVDLNSRTMHVMAAEGSVAVPVTVTFTDKTVVRQGLFRRKPADIKVGEHVDLLYAGSGNTWIADNIDILESSVAVAHYHGTR
jgi:hypothetical protein